MSTPTLTSVRRELKQRIYKERAVWTKNGYQPLCAICGLPPYKGRALEMHETFITRGDVSGNEELLYDIMTKYNCVLVHSDCHLYANSEQNKILCAYDILIHEGYRKTKIWLNCMNGHMVSDVPMEAKRLLIRVRSQAHRIKTNPIERTTMKCKICGKEVFKHSEKMVKDCLKDAGFSTYGKSVMDLLGELQVKVTFNHRHGIVKTNGVNIEDSEDVELDMLRCALTSNLIKEQVAKEVDDGIDE